MKKVFTLCVAIMASVATFAQTTLLWDGEKYNVGEKGGFWNDGNPEVVTNPEKDGINNSDKCLKFVMTNKNKVVKLPFREWTTPSLQGSTRVSLMIKKSQAENIQVELSDPTDGSTGYWKKSSCRLQRSRKMAESRIRLFLQWQIRQSWSYDHHSPDW